MPTVGSTQEIPTDWRERWLSILSRPGVTVPPEPSISRKVVLRLGYSFLLIIVIAIIAGNLQSYFDMPAVVEPILPLAIGFLFWYFGAFAPTQRMFSEGQSGWYGRGLRYSLAKSNRVPVLYLRSFAFDTLSGVQSAAAGGLAKRLTTIEQDLVLKLGTIGPVVALGRPGEDEPPLGAIRIYSTDESWSATIEAAVRCSRIVVWTVGHTAGLRWEIEHLIDNLPPSRLLLWTALALSGTTNREHEENWHRFLDAYGSTFPRPLPATIGNNPFVAFADDWTPIEVPSARYPARHSDPAVMSGITSFVREKRQ